MNETMLLSRLTIRELSQHLSCETTYKAVVDARNARSTVDYQGHITKLYKAQNISGLLFDPGFPLDPVIDGTQFAKLVSVPCWEGYRIERFFPASGSFHGAVNSSPSKPFGSVLEEFEAELDKQSSQLGFAFFKSIIAYRTGLDVRQVGFEEASRAWQEHRSYGDAYEKVIRDYLLAVACRKAQQHGVPLQLHTGHTSHINTWPNANPILLAPFLDLPEIVQTRIVLVHGGYPYCTEAGYLTSVFRNVWCDLSLMIPWASVGIAHRIIQTLESAPTGKVMYGSDGINIPEMNWLGALVGRRSLAQALTTISQDGFLTGSEAEDVAADILYRNAESVYELHSRPAVVSGDALACD